MGKFLFTWELGGGLGHMMQILPMARELVLRRHQVVCALRDLSSAARVFDRQGIVLLQAPVRVGPRQQAIASPRSFAEILHNAGYAVESELRGFAQGWRGLVETVAPDVAIFDHSPTALWCSRGLLMRRVVIGSGFCVPPHVDPLPDLRPWQPADPQRILNCERAVVAKINNILARWSCTPIDRLGQLFSEVDDTFLLTFKELDHYPNRPAETRYRGACIRSEGAAPQWPTGTGKRVYGYLKPFPGLPALLRHLKTRGFPTLLFMERPDEVLIREFSSPTLRFEPRPLDLAAVAHSCDLAIVHGTHGTTVSFLLAGKPTLQLPLLLEQGIFAGAVTRLGAALQPPVERPDRIIADFERMLAGPTFTDAACRFAHNYASFGPIRENQRMVDRLESALNSR